METLTPNHVHFAISHKLYNALCAQNPTSVCTRRPDTDDFHQGAAKAASEAAAFLVRRLAGVQLAWTGPIVGLPPGIAPEARVHVTIDDGPTKTFAMRRRGAPTYSPIDFDAQAAASALSVQIDRVGPMPVPGSGHPTTYRLDLVAKRSITIEGDEDGLMALGLRRGTFERLDADRLSLVADHLADDLLVDDAQTGSRVADAVLRAESAIRAVAIFLDVVPMPPAAKDADDQEDDEPETGRKGEPVRG